MSSLVRRLNRARKTAQTPPFGQENLEVFSSVPLACAALERWAATARAAGCDLGTFTAIVINSDPERIKVELDTRETWRRRFVETDLDPASLDPLAEPSSRGALQVLFGETTETLNMSLATFRESINRIEANHGR
jgi:hypothetical protein